MSAGEMEPLGDAIELHLRRELGLGRAKAAEGAVRRRVRSSRPAAQADVRAAIRAAGMEHAARQHHRGQRAVGAAIHHDVDVLGDEPAVLRHPGPVADDRRVPLRRRGDVLVALVDHPHRPPRLEREQRGVERQHRRVLLLAPKAAAGLLLDDPCLDRVEAQRPLERLVDVVRALHRAVDDDAAVLAGHRDHRLVLDVQLLLVTDPVHALEDEVGLGEARGDIALRNLVLGEHVVRLLRVEHRRERLGDELDPALELAQRLPVRRGQQRDRLGVMPDLATDRHEQRLVVLDQADDVLAGDVRRGGEDHLRPVDVGVRLDREQLRARLGRADGDAVPGAGEDEVVGVLRGAGQLRRAFPAQREPGGATRHALAGVDDETALDCLRAGRQGASGHRPSGPARAS